MSIKVILPNNPSVLPENYLDMVEDGVIHLDFSGCGDVSNEFVHNLLYDYRDTVTRMKFYNVSERVKSSILEGYYNSRRNHSSITQLDQETPSFIEASRLDSRPDILKGVKKIGGHKCKGEYTSTDYYIKGDSLYIFVRAKIKDNSWYQYRLLDYDESQCYNSSVWCDCLTKLINASKNSDESIMIPENQTQEEFLDFIRKLEV